MAMAGGGTKKKTRSGVDGNGAVLDQSDTPMPGLFAAGSTIGGLDGGPNAGYVGGLIKATIALRAAEAIAASYPAASRLRARLPE